MEFKSGWHRCSHEEYLSIPLPSASLFCCAREKTYKHAKAMLDGRFVYKETPAKNFGTAVHAWLFERKTFHEQYAIAGPCVARKRSGEVCGNPGKVCVDGEWYCLTKSHAPGESEAEKKVISESDVELIKGMESSLQGTEVFRLLQTVGRAEVTAIAEVDGLLCKAKLDWLAIRPGQVPVIVDLKKINVGTGSDDELRKRIRDYQYDVRAAFYRQIVFQLTGETPRFIWLFAEDSEPFEIVPREADSAMIGLGNSKLSTVMSGWKDCVASGEYPGYGSTISAIGPEDWELKHWGME